MQPGTSLGPLSAMKWLPTGIKLLGG
jgi:hypothetical protein